MRAPSILQRRSHTLGGAIPFKSLVNDNSIGQGSAHHPNGAGTGERSYRLFVGFDREAGRRDNGKRRYAMGDKGKKDKDKARKQKIKKQEQTAKKNMEKLPTKAPA